MIIITFEENFNNFLKLYKNVDYSFLARPTEKLNKHIGNMLSELNKYFIEQPLFNIPYSFYLYFGSLISVLFHDIGKLLPHFQYKIYRLSKNDLDPIPNEKIKYSYHSLIGTCFAEIFCDEFLSNLQDNFFSGEELKKKGINKDLLKFFVIESIISHHSPYLIEEYTSSIDNLYPGEELDILFNFLNILSQDRIYLFFKMILDSNLKNKNWQFFVEILDLKKENGNFTKSFHNLFNKTIKSTIKKFFRIYINENERNFFDQKPIEKIDELREIRRSIMNHEGDLCCSSVEIYTMQNYISSLLCDLDIWDARFYESKTNKHIFPFQQGINSLSKNIIENYVSNPFGIISKNFKNFNSKKSITIIDYLRTELFQEVNKKNSFNNDVYFLNSPTGAGKTLSLLNLAIKAADQHSNKPLNFYPKIFYLLPFVSIGTQVAEQIIDIFDRDSSLVNSNIITIDNYSTEKIWKFKNHNDEISTIYGRDAKWLISSWGSQFIISTFVKIFHALLKPFKNNYLKFHRLANSILIFDEIQCLPMEYWENVKDILNSISKTLNCTIFLSTATQPAIFDNKSKNHIANTHLYKKIGIKHGSSSKIVKKTIDELLNRYKIKYFPNRLKIDIFAKKLNIFLNKHPKDDILIVVNTKQASIDLYNLINDSINDLIIESQNSEIKILSTLVLPLDRMETINQIKNDMKNKKKKERILTPIKRKIIISTQVIEAGVDLSFKYVFRDFAPLDSIVQIAGRCNRSFEFDFGELFLMELTQKNNSGKTYFQQVYRTNGTDIITKKFLSEIGEHQNNHKIFGKYFEVSEPDLRKKFKEYFQKIKRQNRYKVLNDELKNLKFETLAKNFNIIKKYKNQSPVFLNVNNKSNKLHESWVKGHALNSKFYLYTILLNKKQIDNLIQQGIIEKLGNKNNFLYYFIQKEKLANYYSPELGFRIN